VAGSGASIPEHIHAHLFQKHQTGFPLFEPVSFEPLPGAAGRIWVNRHVTYGILISGTAELIATVIAGLRDEFGCASNHYLKTDPAWGGLVGLYVPRVHALPAVGRLEEADWKFGAFEVLGLFDAKTPEIYETLTTDEACRGIRSVTLQDPTQQRAMETCARELVLQPSKDARRTKKSLVHVGEPL